MNCTANYATLLCAVTSSVSTWSWPKEGGKMVVIEDIGEVVKYELAEDVVTRDI